MRKIERHPSNQGSVITFDMYGQEVKLFVADAKYRAVKKWGTYGINNRSLACFTDDIKHINQNTAGDNITQSLSNTMSDALLQIRFFSFKTDKTAKQNTDILMHYDDTEAAHWCRSIELDGVGALDLPNIYELMIIYLESDRLNALDPTATEYKQFALNKISNSTATGLFKIDECWSSTEYSMCDSRTVGFGDYVYYMCKNNACGVIPVKEISIDFANIHQLNAMLQTLKLLWM